MSGSKRVLFVAAHRREASALAALLPDCSSGPLPFRYTSPEGAILLVGEGRNRLISSLKTLDLRPFSRIVLFGTAGSLITLYARGMTLECPWVYDPDGEVFDSPLTLNFPRGSLVTVAEPVLSEAARDLLVDDVGAVLVDMEGVHFARALQERKAPWIIVKVVSDGPGEEEAFSFGPDLDILLREAAAMTVKALREVSSDH